MNYNPKWVTCLFFISNKHVINILNYGTCKPLFRKKAGRREEEWWILISFCSKKNNLQARFPVLLLGILFWQYAWLIGDPHYTLQFVRLQWIKFLVVIEKRKEMKEFLCISYSIPILTVATVLVQLTTNLFSVFSYI